MEKPQLIVSGSIAIDRIMNFSGTFRDIIHPEKIHVLSISVFLENLEDSRGGVGANICYTLSLLGEKPVLLGSVGKDAHTYVEDLSEMGVDISNINFSKKATASFNVITDMDDNQVGGFYPGAMFDSESLTLEKWKDKNVFVTISPHDPKAMKRQIQECKDYGLKFFYDIGQQVSNADPEDIAEGVDAAELLIVNDYEFTIICEKTKKTPEEIKSKVPVVVITKGKEGSTIEGSKVEGKIDISPAVPREVEDPTGAGDAFRAGFLYGYIRGWDLDLCGKMGSVTSVYAVEHKGTQEHTFDISEFKKRFEENFELMELNI